MKKLDDKNREEIQLVRHLFECVFVFPDPNLFPAEFAEFVGDINERCEEHGGAMFISEKQISALERIVG